MNNGHRNRAEAKGLCIVAFEKWNYYELIKKLITELACYLLMVGILPAKCLHAFHSVASPNYNIMSSNKQITIKRLQK